MKLGPILHFRGQHADRAHYAIVLLQQGGQAPQVSVTGDTLAPAASLALPDGLHWWRFDFELALERLTRQHCYSVEGQEHAFWTPGEGGLRLAYASCNGDAGESAHRQPRPGRNRQWEALARQHAAQPFHLMVHGGDQIYADGVWRELRRHRRRRYPDLTRALLRFYLRRYIWSWQQPAIARVLASVPAVMSWDDHDIFDGWGSLRSLPQDDELARAIFQAARTTCCLLQHGNLPQDSAAALHWHSKLGTTGLIGLDLRSERTLDQVLSARGLGYLSLALEDLRACPQLLLLSSTPMAGPDVSPIEKLFRRVGAGHFVPSDLLDQWSSHTHMPQWRQLLGLLFRHARSTGARVSILSGEIHHGAHAVLSHDGIEIHQYVSSGIAHRPLWRPLTRALDRMTRRGWSQGGVTVIPRAIDDRGHTLLPSENWMALELRGSALPKVVWHGAPPAHANPGVDLRPQMRSSGQVCDP